MEYVVDELLPYSLVGPNVLHKTVRGLQKDIEAGRFGPDIIRLGRSVRVRSQELYAWISAACPPRAKWLEIRDSVMKANP